MVSLFGFMALGSPAFNLEIDPDSIIYDQNSDPSFRYSKGEIRITSFEPHEKRFTKKRMGPDLKRYNSDKKAVEDSIALTESQVAFWQNLVLEIESLKKRLGKPVAMEADSKIILMIVNDEDLDFDKLSGLAQDVKWKEHGKGWRISYSKTLKLMHSVETLNDLYTNLSFNKLKAEVSAKRNKDRQIIKQDLEKGIVSKKLNPHLNELLKRAEKIAKVAPMVAETKIAKIKYESPLYPEYRGYGGYFNEERMLKNYEITLTDTIINPLYKDNLPNLYLNGDLSKFDTDDLERITNFIWRANHKPLDDGWDAAYHQLKLQSFSCYHGNRHSTSGKAAFNSRGELIRIVEPYLWSPYFQDFEYYDPRAVGFYQIAYKNNEYDIHSAGKDVNHYIKIQTDLEGLTAAEEAAQDRAAEKMAGALVGSMTDNMKYGNTKKGREAQRKRAADFVGGMSQGTLKGLSGLNWLNQIQEDYWNRYIQRGPYLVERIDNTSFRLVYADEDLTPAFEMIIKYSSPVPFEVQDIIIVKEL